MTKELQHSDGKIASRIIAGARKHFLSRGFRNVTMEELADELGMSKKTLYAHFESKNDLVKAVLSSKFREIEQELEAITSRSDEDFMGSLQQLLATMQRHTAELQPPFVRDVQRGEPALFELVEERRRLLIQRYFGKLFNAGRKANTVRKDIPTNLIIAILLGATEAIMNPVKMEEYGLTPRTGYAAIISVVLNGVMKNNGT